MYFGDEPYGNTVVYKTIGGAGGGAVKINSKHVDIDGLIAANGEAPDDRFDTGSGLYLSLGPKHNRTSNFHCDLVRE